MKTATGFDRKSGELVEHGWKRHTGRWVRTVVVGVLASAIFVLLLGNAVILGMSAWARHAAPSADAPAEVPGVKNLTVVDGHLWRGSAPGVQGYEALASYGVTTVIDLRAEEDIKVDQVGLDHLGVQRVHIPIRDGQVPTNAEVRQFLDAVSASPGRVFVHCGAGVGRTGTMVAAYLVSNGAADPTEAVMRNLAVGPPSLEQLAFVKSLGDGRPNKPNAAVTALSRVLDAPRRLWSRYGV